MLGNSCIARADRLRQEQRAICPSANMHDEQERRRSAAGVTSSRDGDNRRDCESLGYLIRDHLRAPLASQSIC